MNLRSRLILTFLAVSILPMLLINRYAFAFFHNFAKQQHEDQMVHSARIASSLLLTNITPADRETLLLQHATDTQSRIRLFAPDLTLLHDLGETPNLDLTDNPAVLQARETGTYAARWQLTPTRSHLYYVSALPLLDPDTHQLLGIAQVIRHTGQLTRALAHMKENQTRATWISATASLTLALVIALILTHRLKRLRLAASHYASTGDPDGFDLSGHDEFADLAQHFRDMATQLEDRQTYNRDFVLTTLHELKTPLTAIQGAADLLQRETLPPAERARFTHNIAAQTERLKRLVDELRALTELDIDLPKEPTRLVIPGPFLETLLQRLQPAIPNRIELHGTDLATTPLRINPDRIEQALTNLIENAERYAPDGTPIELHLSENNHQTRFIVRDHGPGIPEENLLRIFDRFFTTVDQDLNRTRGRGLGLAIVTTILEAHRGTVFAYNHANGGACVGFEIPASENLPIARTHKHR